MNIGVVGLGLIGGSIALASKKINGHCRVYGWDNNPVHLRQAIDLSIIDHQLKNSHYKQLDIMILATPVDVALHLIKPILDEVGSDTLVMDTGSTKRWICEQVRNHPKREQFLATHPIAGTEFSGPKAAFSKLFENQTQIFCEIEKTDKSFLERANRFTDDLGMEVLEMSPEDHDKHIAYVSHLSHISSFMLGKTVIDNDQKSDQIIYQMAGSGFASTVRLAKSNPVTWTSIFRHNRENLLDVLDFYIKNLHDFKRLLEDKQYEKIHNQLDNTNRIKEILEGITINHK